MEHQVRAAIYARVSTELQEKEDTIQSQLEALRQYAKEHGHVIVQEFTDEGYSGTTLVRPGLDRLRDALGQGDFEVLLVHSPDRLARKSLYQGILLEEFQKHGIQVGFLNYPVDDSPEGKMLLGMQGLFAEYERAKILERTRRGKLHHARSGHIVGGIAPYGYAYIKREGNQPGHYVINEAEAEVVRTAYRWLLEEGFSLRGIARRLTALGIPTRQGLTRWGQSVAGKLLKSETYAGTAYFYKTYPDIPERHREYKPYRKYPKSTKRLRAKEEWVPISIPALVDRETWEQAQRQLRENAAHSPRNNRRFHYLLRGLVKCGLCGLSYAGGPNGGKPYYRCGGKDDMAARVERCPSRSIQAEVLDSLVWNAMTMALQEPGLLAQEWQRRKSQSQAPDDIETQLKQAALALKRLNAQEDRLIDAYKNEAIELPKLKEEMGKLKARREQLDRQRQEVERTSRERAQTADAVERLEAFCQRVSQGLEHLTFEEKQKLLRLIIDRVVIGDGKVQIYGIIPLDGQSDVIGMRPRYSSLQSPVHGGKVHQRQIRQPLLESP